MRNASIGLLAVFFLGGASDVRGDVSLAEVADPQVVMLLEGVSANLQALRDASYELQIQEQRYVYDEKGVRRSVSLHPKKQQFTSSGESFYFWHNGGGFSGVTYEPTEGVYEAAYHEGTFTALHHTFKSMSVHAESHSGELNMVDPRRYLGDQMLTSIAASAGKTPGLIRIAGQEEVHGSMCVIVEHREAADASRRYWIDQAHGFLPRRTELLVARGPEGSPVDTLSSDTEVEEVMEVAPGVWCPVRVREEAFRGNKDGFHFVRNTVFTAVTVLAEVPDEQFLLKRPPGYYVDDYILGVHYLPENLAEEGSEIQIDEAADDFGSAARPSPTPSGASSGGSPKVTGAAPPPAGLTGDGQESEASNGEASNGKLAGASSRRLRPYIISGVLCVLIGVVFVMWYRVVRGGQRTP